MTEPEQPRRSPAPVLCGLMLALLTFGFWRPWAAYPLDGGILSIGVIIAASGAWIAIVLPGGNVRLPRRLFIVFACALGFMLWWALRTLTAPVPFIAREPAASLIFGTFLFTGAVLLPRASKPEERDTLLKLVCGWGAVIGALFGVHAMIQILGPEGLPGSFATKAAALRAEAEFYSEAELRPLLHALEVDPRAFGVFGAANIFAGFLAFCAPCALGMAFRTKCIAWRGIWIAAAGLTLGGVMLSGSRGGLLAWMGGVVLFVLLTLRLPFRQAATAGAFALLLIVAAAEAQTAPDARWTSTGTIAQRILYWEAGGKLWVSSPMTGTGVGGYEVFYPQVRSPGSQETKFAHNWLVQWAAEGGVVVLILFGAWAGTAWFTAAGSTWRRHGRDPLRSGLLAAVAALVAHGLVDYTFQVHETWLLFCLALGVVAGSVDFPGNVPVMRVPWLMMTALLALPVLVMIPWVLRPKLAEWNRERAEMLLFDNQQVSALATLEGAITLEDDNADFYEFRAMLQTDPRLAEADLLTAIEHYPQSARLHQSLALFYERTGRPEEALEMQTEAVALHPLDVTHRVVLGEMLLDRGRTEDARVQLGMVEGLHLQAGEEEAIERLRSRITSAALN